MTPAATSMPFLRANPLRGAMRPYNPGGMAIWKPRLIAFRDCGGILVFTALKRSYPIEPGVDRLGSAVIGLVLKEEEIWTVDECR